MAVNGERKQRGVSLLEAMLLVALAGAVLSVALLYLQAGDAARDTARQQQALRWADQALAGFAMHHARLPCPASTPMGVENCTALTGWLPLATLDPHNRGVDMQQIRYTLAGEYLAAPRDRVNLGANLINELDFCAELEQSGSMSVPAYTLALSDAGSASASTVPPRERTIGALSESLFCAGVMQSLDGLAVAQDVSVEVYDQRLWSMFSIGTSAAIAGVKTAVAGAGVIMAAVSLVKAIATMATAVSALATAIGTCVLLVGCALIPTLAAAVAASAAAIASATAAVALSATSAALSGTATGFAVALAVTVGTAPDDTPALDFATEIAAVEQVLDEMDQQLREMQRDHDGTVQALADLDQQRDNLRHSTEQELAIMDPEGTQQDALAGLFERIDERTRQQLEWDQAEAQYQRQQQALADIQQARGDAEAEYQRRQQALQAQQQLPDGDPNKNVRVAELALAAADNARADLQTQQANLQGDIADSHQARQQAAQRLADADQRYQDDRAQLMADYEEEVRRQRADARCGVMSNMQCSNPPPPGCGWFMGMLSCERFESDLPDHFDEYVSTSDAQAMFADDDQRQRDQINELQSEREQTEAHLASLRALENTVLDGEQDDGIWQGVEAILEQADRRGALR